MNFNGLTRPKQDDSEGYPVGSAVTGLIIADPLYAVELRDLKRRRARAKGRGEDTAELEARIALVDSRLHFYDDVLAGYCLGFTGGGPVRGLVPEYETVVPETVVPETVVPAGPGVPKFAGTITEVGGQLAGLKAKAVKLEVKQGAAFAVVKQTPAAGDALPGDGSYGLGLQAPAAWVNNPVVLMAMLYRLAPEWLLVKAYAATSDTVGEAIAKVVAQSEMARLKSDADRQIDEWVPKIIKAAGVDVKAPVLKAALKFTVAYLK